MFLMLKSEPVINLLKLSQKIREVVTLFYGIITTFTGMILYRDFFVKCLKQKKRFSYLKRSFQNYNS